MAQYRHGDVFIMKTEKSELKGQKTDIRLLAEGEGRNHGHVIEGEVDIYEYQDERSTTHFLDVKSTSVLKHLLIDRGDWTGEHVDIVVPPGIYRVIRQREYDPYEQRIREVND
jgi:hypothetical protein